MIQFNFPEPHYNGEVMEETMKELPEMPVIDGILWFPGTTKEMIDTFPKLQAREDDIYISTYPKAGKRKPACIN